MTVLGANLGCDQIKYMPEIISKRFHTAIWTSKVAMLYIKFIIGIWADVLFMDR